MADETCGKGIETERHTDSYLRCSRYSLRRLTHYVADKEMTMFRLIPNTAISEMESMTLIASRNATKEQEQLMLDIFNQMGLAMLIPEEKIAATTAMTSCGIAYVLKYIQAAMQAGIEMGIYPKTACAWWHSP